MEHSAAKIRPSFINGMVYIAVFLAVTGLPGVLSLHSPGYLTTPRLREVYSEGQVRALLFSGLVLGSLLAVAGVVLSTMKRLSLMAPGMLVVARLAGGAIAGTRPRSAIGTGLFQPGSRLHIVDVLVTRSISPVPMVVLGFSPEAINIYLPILALQSVFIHRNLQTARRANGRSSTDARDRKFDRTTSLTWWRRSGVTVETQERLAAYKPRHSNHLPWTANSPQVARRCIQLFGTGCLSHSTMRLVRCSTVRLWCVKLGAKSLRNRVRFASGCGKPGAAAERAPRLVHLGKP